jgi:uridine nucleosidase
VSFTRIASASRKLKNELQDAFAILLAAYHPSLHLLGISTGYGNASLDRTTNNALSILEAIGRSDIPVIAGARKPFCREPCHAPEIHGTGHYGGSRDIFG